MNGRNAYYQKQVADQVSNQAAEIMSLLTDALWIHLNIGQNFTVDASSIFLMLGKAVMGSLSDRVLSQAGSVQVHMPSLLYSNQTTNTPVIFRVCSLSLFNG